MRTSVCPTDERAEGNRDGPDRHTEDRETDIEAKIDKDRRANIIIIITNFALK